jgi:hypothetical protein
MTHKRKDIRDAVVSILSGASIVGAGKVFSNQSVPVDPADLPIINVMVITESSEPHDFGTDKLMRDMTLVVQVAQKDVDDATIDDKLDELAKKVEDAMKADASLGGGAMDSYLTSTELVVDGDGEVTVGVASMSYRVRYEA